MLELLLLAVLGTGQAPVPAPAAAPPPVRHVFVIVLENKNFDQTFKDRPAARYLARTLPSQGALLVRYYGIGHASATNYIAMISGQPPTPKSQDDCGDPLTSLGKAATADGIARGDGCIYPAKFLTIGDQLTRRGLRWRGYMEGIDRNCSLASKSSTDPKYGRKHNPFVFFRSLRDSGQCAANDVSLRELPADLATTERTPNYAFIVPNQCNDAHDSCAADDPDGLKWADAFLKRWVPRILASPAFRADGLLIVTFDEAETDSSACCKERPGPAARRPGGDGPGGGLIGAVLVSPFIAPGTVSANPYNHYSLLRSVEDLFGLEHLGYARPSGTKSFGPDVYTNASRRPAAPASP
jgi:hypothetical protein